MAQAITLVKLHLEIPASSISRSRLKILNSMLRTAITVNYYKFNRLSSIPYPVVLKVLLSMVSVRAISDTVWLGLWYDAAHSKSTFNTVLDCEYGVTGPEMRVVRKALEYLVTEINGGGS